VKALVSLGALAGVLAVVVAARGEPGATPRGAELGRRGDTSVALGIVGERRSTHAELAAYVGVTVPLERVLARRSADAAAAAQARELDESEAAVERSTARDADAVEPTARDGSASESGGSEPALSSELFSRLARDAVAAAENAHHLAEREGELDGLGTRARWSAILPEVRIRAARSRDDSLHMQPTLEDPYRYSTIGGDGLLLEAQATFRLNRLLFADEEVAVERLRLVRERAGEDRAERVTARLSHWYRALSRERSLLPPEARARATLERVESEMELDVLTDGWFGERVRRLGLGSPPVERPDPAPSSPAAPKPASKPKASPERPALADLDASPASATSASPCLPKRATDSKTFCGVLMR